MAFEQYANNAGTILNGAINNAATSITVASASGFPSQGNFRILIDSEVMLVSAVSGTTWTVARGAESTTAASHNDAAAVTHVLTAGSLAALTALNVRSGTLVNLPSAAQEGRLYLPVDSPYLHRDSGSTFDTWWAPRFKKPPASSWSWVNQGSATIDYNLGPARLYLPGSNGAPWRGLARTLPAAPYTITSAFYVLAGNFDSFQAGVGLRDSGSGKLVLLQYHRNGTFYYQKWNSESSFNSDYGSHAVWPVGSLWHIKIVDDTSNRTFYISHNGLSWHLFMQHLRTDFLTPNQFVFGGIANNNWAVPIYFDLVHYAEA